LAEPLPPPLAPGTRVRLLTPLVPARWESVPLVVHLGRARMRWRGQTGVVASVLAGRRWTLYGVHLDEGGRVVVEAEELEVSGG
jgi:hypothetical protein